MLLKRVWQFALSTSSQPQSKLLPVVNQLIGSAYQSPPPARCSMSTGGGGPSAEKSAKEKEGGGEGESISSQSSQDSVPVRDDSSEGILFPVTGHRLFYGEYGEPQTVIRKERSTIDEVKPGQVLVEMLAAPVNPADINTIQGTYAIKPKQLPAVPGNEGVGVVVHSELDNNASSGDAAASTPTLSVGDWVIPSTPGIGTWQAYLTGSHTDFIKIPSKNMPIVSAATLSVNPCTAYRMLMDFEKLNPGDCVIQNGGNSAVGQAVIQLCREFGLKCVSLIRPREDFKAIKAKLLNLGNNDTIVITDEELRSSMKGKAQLGLNCVGGKSATEIIRVLEPSRTLVTYGGMSRQPVIVPTSHLIFNDIRLKGFWMTRWNAENTIEERTKMLESIAGLIQANKFAAPEHKLVPLAKYREALENTMKGYSGVKYIISFKNQ